MYRGTLPLESSSCSLSAGLTEQLVKEFWQETTLPCVPPFCLLEMGNDVDLIALLTVVS